ncbi:SDR family NAD(P)-dependent oxidoreductase [Amycolatopsis sp. NPDC059090]|uniref:SDR family NAD(P)-dependent oxidoreductase n=1 Tax=unclassified Amycolatopsis TaxID=2618356 RepID=UPI00366D8418
MHRFKGTVAVVSGAASARGIGRATAQLLVAEGAQVVVGDVLDEQGAAFADELGPNARYAHLDVSREADWASLAADAAARFGKVTALVNCAGIAADGTIESSSLADYDRVVAVSQTGAWLGIRAMSPLIRAAGGGAIVNVSSVAGAVGQPCLGSYSAAKWAIRGITRQAALELADSGIRVNAVLPGFIDTMMGGQGAGQRENIAHTKSQSGATVPMGRIGEPREVAAMVAFLLSEESSYCTGADFVIDGGLLAGPLAEAADWG